MLARGETSASSIELEIYAGAAHGFDNPGNGTGIYRADVWNPSKEPTLGATLAFDSTAEKQAIERVKDFLGSRFE